MVLITFSSEAKRDYMYIQCIINPIRCAGISFIYTYVTAGTAKNSSFPSRYILIPDDGHIGQNM
jgi:hypothetical protein